MDRVFKFVETVSEENVEGDGDKIQSGTLDDVLGSVDECCMTVISGTSPEIFKVREVNQDECNDLIIHTNLMCYEGGFEETI